MPTTKTIYVCATCQSEHPTEEDAKACEDSDAKGPCRLCLGGRAIERVGHPDNHVDWQGPGSGQYYQVYHCKCCGEYWGCRHQWRGGSGSDNRWHNFSKSIDAVARHC